MTDNLSAERKKPNIIFILSDDQGAWAMHCAGVPEMYTPNLDRIAAEGMLFENFFCVSPVCSPARASLLTGTIPSAHGVHDWIRSGNVDGERFRAQGREIPYAGGYAGEVRPAAYLEGQVTYTDLLAENGYTCALAGKWHLGDSVRMQYGFSKWYSLGRGGCSYYHADVTENGDIRVEHGKYVTELITDRALQWMEELAREENPYYLSVHYTAPHSPWGEKEHPEKWMDYYRDCSFASIPDVPDHPHMTTGPVYRTEKRYENLRGYFAAVSAMDEQIGRILQKVREMDSRRETILIFTADNGMSMGHHGVWGKGNGTFPMNLYDTAVKVPFLAWWKGHIPEGSVNRELVSAYDVFPTLLELAGITWEGTEKLPGRSFADQLLSGGIVWGAGRGAAAVRDEVKESAAAQKAFGGERRESAAVRKAQKGESRETQAENTGDHTVVVYDEYGPARMIRSKEWKYIHRYPYGAHELYDLKNDPGEEKNLYGDPQYDGKIVELRCRMEGWFARYVRGERNGIMQAVTGAGQDCPVGKRADRVNIYGSVEEI